MYQRDREGAKIDGIMIKKKMTPNSVINTVFLYSSSVDVHSHYSLVFLISGWL